MCYQKLPDAELNTVLGNPGDDKASVFECENPVISLSKHTAKRLFMF